MIFNSDTIIAAAISAIPPTIVALAALVASLRNGRTINEVKKATDGMKDELVKVTRSDALQEGRAEGHIAGVAEEQAREPQTVKIDDTEPVKVQAVKKP